MTSNFFLLRFQQWSEIQEFDVSDVEEEFEKRMDDIRANDCCVLVYTVIFGPLCPPPKPHKSFESP